MESIKSAENSREEPLLETRIIDWARDSSLPVDAAAERWIRKLLSPQPLQTMEEVSHVLKPRPPYLGPGIWLKAIDLPMKGGPHV